MEFDLSLPNIIFIHMNTFLRKFWKPLLFVTIGAVAGFAYWRFVGCSSGSCAITANWHTSTLMGGLMGFLLVGDNRKKTNKTGDSNS